jgi:hypothetical protein
MMSLNHTGTKFINPGANSNSGWKDTEYSHRMYLLPYNSVPGTGNTKTSASPLNAQCKPAFDGMATITGRRSWVKKWSQTVVVRFLSLSPSPLLSPSLATTKLLMKMAQEEVKDVGCTALTLSIVFHLD